MVELNINMWLVAADVEKCNTGKFVDEGEVSAIPGEGDKPGKPTFEIGIRLNNDVERVWTINKTSQLAIAKIYGSDTKSWVGKPFTLFVSEQNVNGTMKKVIYARTPVE